MPKPGNQKLWQAIGCLLSAALAWRNMDPLDGSEFRGGRLTGPLLTMADTGIILFVLALLVTFVYRRVGAAIALTASLLCLPLYLYFTAPGPFRRAFGGEYSVPLPANFVENKWMIAGVLILALTTYICLRGFAVLSREKVPEKG